MAIITISRGTRSGGKALAECLAEKLHYPQLGREVIQEAAVRLGVSEDDLGHKMEDAPRFWGRHSVTRHIYLVAVQAALAEHAITGNLVYHGLAGQLLLKGLPSVLRVRLIAPLEMRIRALMESEDMDSTAAEQFIKHVDEARARWVKMMYGEDINDPALYDVVVNFEMITPEGACDLLAAAASQADFGVTEEVRAKLGDFLLACRVKLALVSAPETRSLELEVEAQAGRVEISGSVPLLSGGSIENRLSQIASSVPGVEDIHLKLQWYDPYP